jgi:MFS family permease
MEVRLWVLFLLFTGTLINAIDRSSLATANTYIVKDLHLDLASMGLVLFSFGWAYLLFNLPAGWMCDRFGTKKVYGVSAMIWSIASALTGLAKGIFLLFFSRILVGAGEAANFPAATKVIAENFPEQARGAATGMYLAGLRLGFAVTPALMVWIMLAFGTPEHPNWPMAFLITGLGSLAWVVLWFLTYREKRDAASGILAPCAERGALKKIMKQRNTWAIIFIKFFQDYLYYLFLTWLPGYLATARHLDLKHVAFYATLPWVAGMLAQPLIGALSDRLVNAGHDSTRVKKTLLILMQVLSLAVIGAALADSATTAAWLLVLTMAAESASTAILWSLPSDLAPKGMAGTLGGIMNTAGAVASIVSPALTGWIAQYFGFAAALVLGGGMMIAAALSVLFYLTKISPMNFGEENHA